MSELHIVILAAGKGTRMKSARPKVLHELAGRPLIGHVLRTAEALNASETVVVVGHGADAVKDALSEHKDLQYVLQSPQLGTGHALLQTEPILSGRTGTLLLLYADVPLLQLSSLQRLLEHHKASHAAATVLTARLPDPYGYGRIVRDAGGRIERIVEERDASSAERTISEVNSGIYALALEPLFDSLHRLAIDNAQGEYYLTDLVTMYRRAKTSVQTLCLEDATEIRGVNSRVDLAELGAIARARKRRSVMLDGATLEDADSVLIDDDVTIGPDSVIGPGVILSGRTVVGGGCRIHAGVRVTDSVIGDRVTILDRCLIVKSQVQDGASVGPFAHLRPNSIVSAGAHVGNFVELKNTVLGPGSKAGHLTYLGDATIGEHVNIGAGTITCNYDGVQKHRTIIEDGVFVGSDSQLVAPVRVGKGAYIAAGSSITGDVPAESLAVARARQVNKPGWAADRAKRRKEESR